MAVSSRPIQTAASHVKRRLPRTRRGWLIAIVTPILALLLILYLAARSTPSWYQPLDASSQPVIDAADLGWHKVFSGLHNSFQRTPLGDQLWTISQMEVNSMLAVRVPAPEQAEPGHEYPVISSPFVQFSEGGRVTLAARTTKLPGPRPGGGVASITFSLTMIPADPGMPPHCLVQIESAYAGRLRIPRSIVEDRIRNMMPVLVHGATQTVRLTTGRGSSDSSKLVPEVEERLRAIERGEPIPLNFPYDGRTVVVKDIRVEDGALTIVFGPPVPAAVRPRPAPGK